MTTAPETATVLVRLKPERDSAVREGHPWVFSGAVRSVEGPPEAPLARVATSKGEVLGVGLYSPRSQIRVRMLTGPEGADGAIDRAFFRARLEEAIRLRRVVVAEGTTGYRVLNAEGDGVPGWTVDRYGDVLVSQVTAAGLEVLRPEAYAALAEVFPGTAILQSNEVPARKIEGLGREDETIAGPLPDEALFLENGLRFAAEVTGGQKTGFYLDQRENRRLAERLGAERSVLDLFAHAGAFGLYALRGGARRVTHVESSPRLIERGQAAYALNPELPAERVEWVRGSVFEHLRAHEERFDLVICDPPPLARRRDDVQRAARAYKDLNRLAFGRTAPGGHLLTFSCSSLVDGKLFRQILFAAATEARRRVRLLAPLAAAPDHPVAITHPQGEYLKGWWCQVE
ncbi:MAG TPA: class I SAM-dependent rRNA methyltransferase [Thermoanaerobaculia bacterium]|nr:class I SAM-dependent rRNA methyltransferase [Thermoanaerobaculia bacterium]